MMLTIVLIAQAIVARKEVPRSRGVFPDTDRVMFFPVIALTAFTIGDDLNDTEPPR